MGPTTMPSVSSSIYNTRKQWFTVLYLIILNALPLINGPPMIYENITAVKGRRVPTRAGLNCSL